MQRQNDFSNILIELEIRCSDRKWQRLQRGVGSLLIWNPEAIQILNNHFLRIIHKNKLWKTKDKAMIRVWSQTALDLILELPGCWICELISQSLSFPTYNLGIIRHKRVEILRGLAIRMKTPGRTWQRHSWPRHCHNSIVTTVTMTRWWNLGLLAELFFKQPSSDMAILRWCQWLSCTVILGERIIVLLLGGLISILGTSIDWQIAHSLSTSSVPSVDQILRCVEDWRI